MRFEKIAELAGDITISEEKKELMKRNCKEEYLNQRDSSSRVSVMRMQYYMEKHQAQ